MADQTKDHAVITVRLSPSLHAAVKEMAYQRRTSMNKLCIAALERLLADLIREEEEDLARILTEEATERQAEYGGKANGQEESSEESGSGSLHDIAIARASQHRGW